MAKMTFPTAADEKALAAVKTRSTIDYAPYQAGIRALQERVTGGQGIYAYINLDNKDNAKVERRRFVTAGKTMDPQVGVKWHKNSTDDRLVMYLGKVQTRERKTKAGAADATNAQ